VVFGALLCSEKLTAQPRFGLVPCLAGAGPVGDLVIGYLDRLFVPFWPPKQLKKTRNFETKSSKSN
jgi:hypothetical protein